MRTDKKKKNPEDIELLEQEMFQKIIGNIKTDCLKQILYDNVDEAEIVIKPVRSILFENSTPTEKQFEDAAFFYWQLWVRLHGPLVSAFVTTLYTKKAMKDAYSQFSGETVTKAVDFCLEYIYQRDPYIRERDELIGDEQIVDDEYDEKHYLEILTVLENKGLEPLINRSCMTLAYDEDDLKLYYSRSSFFEKQSGGIPELIISIILVLLSPFFELFMALEQHPVMTIVLLALAIGMAFFFKGCVVEPLLDYLISK